MRTDICIPRRIWCCFVYLVYCECEISNWYMPFYRLTKIEIEVFLSKIGLEVYRLLEWFFLHVLNLCA